MVVMVDDGGSIPVTDRDCFLFAIASRPTLGFTQPPILSVPGALTLKVKRPEREANHSPVSIAEVKNG
jgi:hypothetical protein